MVIATLFFFGLALCIFAALMCLALAKSVQTARAHHLPADEKLAWSELKTAMADLYSRYETEESPRQKSLRSWAGTFIVCAGLCLIGLVIGIDYNNAQTSSTSSTLFSFLGSQRVTATQSAHHPERQPQSKDKPVSQPTK